MTEIMKEALRRARALYDELSAGGDAFTYPTYRAALVERLKGLIGPASAYQIARQVDRQRRG